MNVLFAPDYRDGNPYQALLADALSETEIDVAFLSHMRRGMPLSRGVKEEPVDILHIHWPEKYFQQKHDRLDGLRLIRYPTDLALATRATPLVVTAHNLFPHDRNHHPLVQRNIRVTLQRAAAVIAHSSQAADQLREVFSIPSTRLHVIPHGDLSAALPAPSLKAAARERLNLSSRPVCLMFGAVTPYKGILEIVTFWHRYQPNVELIIAGAATDPIFARELHDLVDGIENARFLDHFLDDTVLVDWLSAADCTLFNYQSCFTSGAACLSRSLGLPILLPTRLVTIDLAEPNDRVLRFNTLDRSLLPLLQQAIEMGSSFATAKPWRETTSWHHLALATSSVYRRILS